MNIVIDTTTVNCWWLDFNKDNNIEVFVRRCVGFNRIFGVINGHISANDLTFWSLAFSLRTTRFNIQNSSCCSLCAECFVRISEQTATFALYIINWLVFITVVESVYCAVRTDYLHKADYV